MERGHAVLKVLHQVGGHQVQAPLGSDQGLDRGPLALQAFLLALRIILG
ncbi:hypothetical protein [uncultured Thiodictyon sp.]|nr:hypothetical protein [uncultured Thiodictyon sp.]